MLEALKDNKGTYGVLARKKLGMEEPVENGDTAENEDNQLDSDGDGDNQQDTDDDNDDDDY